jgi:hypothetical protein
MTVGADDRTMAVDAEGRTAFATEADDIMDQFTKDPSAVKDYTVDWSTYLGADTILTASWVVPSAITATSPTKTSTTATVWISGGVAGDTYQVTSRVTTAGGRQDDRSFLLTIQEQ